jgi:predicted RNA-binding protein with PUA-like domain
MKKFWAMKTFQGWWATFNANGVVGIDQDGVDQDYTTYSDAAIAGLLSGDGYSEYIDRVFREFCKWMEVGDLVIIGTGKVAKFYISGIVRITSDYYFDPKSEPRHLRRVEILKAFDNPPEMQRFLRTSRLELIDENDFHESIISLL